MIGIQDYFCGMYFDIPSRRFLNTKDEDVAYNWRTDVTAKDMSLFDEATYDSFDDDGEVSSRVSAPRRQKKETTEEQHTTNAPLSRAKDEGDDELPPLPYMPEYMEQGLPF